MRARSFWRGAAFRAPIPSRRLSSRSIAARMKSARLSPIRKTASMRSSVPAGSRAGVKSSLIRGRPISLKLLISLIDKPE